MNTNNDVILEEPYKYAIVIPTYNNEQTTVKCLGSIKKHTSNYIIVWIDDGSSKNSRKIVKTYLVKNSMPFVYEKNIVNEGFIVTANKGLHKAFDMEIPYIVLQNNDTIVFDNWLQGMVGILQNNKGVGIVGPLSTCGRQRIAFVNKNYGKIDDAKNLINELPLIEVATQLIQKYGDKKEYIQIFDRVAFFSTVFRRDVISDIGFLSEEYGVGFWDDDDYCERALRFGWDVVIAKSSFVQHECSTTFNGVYNDQKGRRARMKHENNNQDIFEKKFSYGKYENECVINMNERELKIRLWRKQKECKEMYKKVDMMKSSAFWKLRDKYMNIKNLFK